MRKQIVLEHTDEQSNIDTEDTTDAEDVENPYLSELIAAATTDSTDLSKAAINALHTDAAMQLEADKNLNDLHELQVFDIDSVRGHAESYSQLLKGYTTHLCATLKFKRIAKMIFFGVVTLLLLVTASLLAVVVWHICTRVQVTEVEDISVIMSLVAALISAFGAFMSAIIVLPKIVAKYLFNRGEEESIANIVGNMQQYDRDIRDRLE